MDSWSYSVTVKFQFITGKLGVVATTNHEAHDGYDWLVHSRSPGFLRSSSADRSYRIVPLSLSPDSLLLTRFMITTID